MSIENLRNIAIVAHVDHGKTTLVDQLLKQSGTLSERTVLAERVMDSNDQEKERGITILAKNTAITWEDKKTGTKNRINIVDTPGHADFGGEVERVLSMVDTVLILVDAMDGPMPQTRFVTQKAFAMGFKPVVVVNKVDRPGARPEWVVEQVWDLFERLGATDEQMDFPIVYASALNGYAGLDENVREGDMTPLYEAIMQHAPKPDVDPEGAFQMRISQLDYNNFVGIIGIGRIQRGTLKKGMPVAVIDRHGKKRQGKVAQVLGFLGLERIEQETAEAGDIVAISGISELTISDTITALDTPEALPPLTVDEPMISMTFQVNNSPFVGNKDLSGGKFLTSRQLRERLERETRAQRCPARGRRLRRRQVPGLGPWRTASVGADRKHASRRLRAGRVASGSDRQGNRRPEDGADRTAGGRPRGNPPGSGDGAPGYPQGPAQEHGAGRQGPRAP